MKTINMKNKMKGKAILYILIAAFCLFTSHKSYSQGAAINSSGTSADNSAILDVSSTTQGVLISRMTEAQRNAIVNPAFGLQIFNTTSGCINFWVGTTWKQLCGDCDFNSPVPGNNGPICQGSTLNLTATTILGATYQWSGPNGFTSTLQNPVISNAAASAGGTYSVTAIRNGCTSQPLTTVAIVNAAPVTPVITNNGPLCSGQNLVLTTSAIPGATYSWTGPNSFTANTQNPTLSNVTGANAGAYQLVETVNGCQSSPGLTTTVIYTTSPALPGTISGPTVNLGNQTGVIYSISPVNFATSYAWTVPAGASITGGQGGTSITVDYTCSGSGNIAVTASNACGTSPQQTLGVSTVNQVPGIITGPTAVCQNSNGNVYSISAIPFASSYTWTVPSDASITSGQGTTSITVATGINSGNIIVTQTTNSCGISGQSTLAINNNSISTFTFSPSPTISNQNTTFTPTNTSGATYNWTFSGGTPSTSTSVSPVIFWSNKGTYNVTLTVNGCTSTSTTNSVIVNGSQTFSYTGSLQTFTIPSGVNSITIQANGAQGGLSGGSGASMQGTFTVTPGHILNILVGGQGTDGSGYFGGGGGGSFVVDNNTSTLLIAAGGGGGRGCCGAPGPPSVSNATTSQNGLTGWYGGCSSGCGGYNTQTAGVGGTGGNGGGTASQNPSGGGGGGYFTDGASGGAGGGKSYLNGGAGGASALGGGNGGYGGGGGAEGNWDGAGGGGGYSGGGGGYYYGEGGGGGSYNSGTNQTNLSGIQSGNGQVIFSW